MLMLMPELLKRNVSRVGSNATSSWRVTVMAVSHLLSAAECAMLSTTCLSKSNMLQRARRCTFISNSGYWMNSACLICSSKQPRLSLPLLILPFVTTVDFEPLKRISDMLATAMTSCSLWSGVSMQRLQTSERHCFMCSYHLCLSA